MEFIGENKTTIKILASKDERNLKLANEKRMKKNARRLLNKKKENKNV
jgi:hypothetical protein